MVTKHDEAVEKCLEKAREEVKKGNDPTSATSSALEEAKIPPGRFHNDVWESVFHILNKKTNSPMNGGTAHTQGKQLRRNDCGVVRSQLHGGRN